jgi:hypothetical protein
MFLKKLPGNVVKVQTKQTRHFHALMPEKDFHVTHTRLANFRFSLGHSTNSPQLDSPLSFNLPPIDND